MQHGATVLDVAQREALQLAHAQPCRVQQRDSHAHRCRSQRGVRAGLQCGCRREHARDVPLAQDHGRDIGLGAACQLRRRHEAAGVGTSAMKAEVTQHLSAVATRVGMQMSAAVEPGREAALGDVVVPYGLQVAHDGAQQPLLLAVLSTQRAPMCQVGGDVFDQSRACGGVHGATSAGTSSAAPRSMSSCMRR